MNGTTTTVEFLHDAIRTEDLASSQLLEDERQTRGSDIGVKDGGVSKRAGGIQALNRSQNYSP